MVQYSRILVNISKNFGSRLSAPGNGRVEAASAEDALNEPTEPTEPTVPDVVRIGHVPGDVDGETLARLFRQTAEVKDEPRAPALPDASEAEETEPSPMGRKPFRNHAELLRFASGIISDIEQSLRRRREKKKRKRKKEKK
jgi:hypothetical protein